MSVSRLIIAIVWLALSLATFVARRRVRARRASGIRTGRGTSRRVSVFLLSLSVLYLLLGLLWLDLAL